MSASDHESRGADPKSVGGTRASRTRQHPAHPTNRARPAPHRRVLRQSSSGHPLRSSHAPQESRRSPSSPSSHSPSASAPTPPSSASSTPSSFIRFPSKTPTASSTSPAAALPSTSSTCTCRSPTSTMSRSASKTLTDISAYSFSSKEVVVDGKPDRLDGADIDENLSRSSDSSRSSAAPSLPTTCIPASRRHPQPQDLARSLRLRSERCRQNDAARRRTTHHRGRHARTFRRWTSSPTRRLWTPFQPTPEQLSQRSERTIGIAIGALPPRRNNRTSPTRARTNFRPPRRNLSRLQQKLEHARHAAQDPLSSATPALLYSSCLAPSDSFF